MTTTIATQIIPPTSCSLADIERTARSLFASDEFQNLLEHFMSRDNHYTGGYLCIMRPTEDNLDNPLRRTALIGATDPRKSLAYISFANEKALRLNRNPASRSSFLTRNEVLQQYGGGIRTPKWILAFSGLPELLDEVFVLGIARARNLAPLPYLYNEIAMLSRSDILFRNLLTTEEVESLRR